MAKQHPHFTPECFKFLRQLKRNNNRDWFQKNKPRYERDVRDPFLAFIEDVRPHLLHISPHFIADPKRSGGSLMRIYRDMRFRPDADPYKTNAAAQFPHVASKQIHAPGFYLHLEPRQSFLAMGLWHPEPEIRARVREAIVTSPSEWKKAAYGKGFRAMYRLGGESTKKMPPGYDVTHPFAEDLRRKDFICSTEFSEEQVCAEDFLVRVSQACGAAGPFMEFLTRSLGLPWKKEEKMPARDPVGVDSIQLA